LHTTESHTDDPFNFLGTEYLAQPSHGGFVCPQALRKGETESVYWIFFCYVDSSTTQENDNVNCSVFFIIFERLYRFRSVHFLLCSVVVSIFFAAKRTAKDAVNFDMAAGVQPWMEPAVFS
jgi:hypothetical protein